MAGNVRLYVTINGKPATPPKMNVAELGGPIFDDLKGGHLTFCEDGLGRAYVMWRNRGNERNEFTRIELDRDGDGFHLYVGRMAEKMEAEKGANNG